MCPRAYRAALFLGSGGRGGYRRSPQERPDARLEGKDVEGLCDIIIRAGLKAHEQVCVLAARGEHDYRHGGEAADFLTGFEPVFLRHHQVEDYEVIVPLACHRDGGLAVIAGIDRIALILKIELDALDKQLFIINYKNFH